MAGITLERVSKVYGDGTLAVDDLSLEVGDGEFMVLIFQRRIVAGLTAGAVKG